MTMRDISRRLDRLDSARPIADRRVICMVQEEGETQPTPSPGGVRKIPASLRRTAMSDDDLWRTLSQREGDDAYELHDLDTEGTTHHG
jgi:hypothetical protein